MQEFQERNVFFDSTPLADVDDYCRCRDWCVENYPLDTWQAPQEVAQAQQAQQPSAPQEPAAADTSTGTELCGCGCDTATTTPSTLRPELCGCGCDTATATPPTLRPEPCGCGCDTVAATPLTPGTEHYNDWLWPDGAPTVDALPPTLPDLSVPPEHTAVDPVDNASGYEQEMMRV